MPQKATSANTDIQGVGQSPRSFDAPGLCLQISKKPIDLLQDRWA